MPGQQGPIPSGPNDLWPWLQSILQNQGAGQPNSVAGMPRYGTGPGDLGMGDPRGLTANTPGAPSMGYPALGALGAQPQPPPPSQLQDSLTVNPHGDGPPDVMSPAAMAAAAAQPQPQPAPNGQGGIGAYPDSTNYPHNMTPPTFNWPASSTPTGMPAPPAPAIDATPKPAGPLASSGGGGATMKRTPGAPNLGYYQQNPRFGTVQYQTPNSSASRAPIYTTLNLGGGQQPGANPANVPAANAQPVSSASPPASPSNSPLPPIMPGDIRNQRVANAVRNPNWWQNL